MMQPLRGCHLFFPQVSDQCGLRVAPSRGADWCVLATARLWDAIHCQGGRAAWAPRASEAPSPLLSPAPLSVLAPRGWAVWAGTLAVSCPLPVENRGRPEAETSSGSLRGNLAPVLSPLPGMAPLGQFHCW